MPNFFLVVCSYGLLLAQATTIVPTHSLIYSKECGTLDLFRFLRFLIVFYYLADYICFFYTQFSTSLVVKVPRITLSLCEQKAPLVSCPHARAVRLLFSATQFFSHEAGQHWLRFFCLSLESTDD
jgi:hypothetical protein